jgi:hypothetical protein
MSLIVAVEWGMTRPTPDRRDRVEPLERARQPSTPEEAV